MMDSVRGRTFGYSIPSK
jgi:hypothetical protein